MQGKLLNYNGIPLKTVFSKITMESRNLNLKEINVPVNIVRKGNKMYTD